MGALDAIHVWLIPTIQHACESIEQGKPTKEAALPLNVVLAALYRAI